MIRTYLSRNYTYQVELVHVDLEDGTFSSNYESVPQNCAVNDGSQELGAFRLFFSGNTLFCFSDDENGESVGSYNFDTDVVTDNLVNTDLEALFSVEDNVLKGTLHVTGKYIYKFVTKMEEAYIEIYDLDSFKLVGTQPIVLGENQDYGYDTLFLVKVFDEEEVTRVLVGSGLIRFFITL